MARSAKILEIIEEENLVENARIQGEFLLAELKKLQSDFPSVVSNARGLGLLCAFDFENGDKRGEFLNACFKEKLAMLGCGSKSVRFRPALNITREDLEKGLNIIKKVLSSMS
jgi:L-lysine 6-transaminase